MTKEEIKNLIIWSLLCIICFALFALGLNKYNQGYGKSGRIKKELTPIVEKFNSLQSIKNSPFPIKAKYSNKKIIVEYESESIDTTFEFQSKEIGNTIQISTTYPKSIEESAKKVIENMVDAVSIINGNYENEVFSKYKYENFYTTESEHGFTLRDNLGEITATISTNVNLLDQIEDIFFEETKITYISYDDLKNMKYKLEDEKQFSFTKGNLSMYVVETDYKYIIYCTDKKANKDDLYNSILAAVNILDIDAYNDMSKINLNITTDFIRKNYEIKVNPEKIENDYEISGNPLIRLTLTKKLEEK